MAICPAHGRAPSHMAQPASSTNPLCDTPCPSTIPTLTSFPLLSPPAALLTSPFACCSKGLEDKESGINLKESRGGKRSLWVCWLVDYIFFWSPPCFDRCLLKPALAEEQKAAVRGRCYNHLPGRARFEQSNCTSKGSFLSFSQRAFWVFFLFGR